MVCRVVSIIAVFGALVPATAHAQTNLDQGKSASQIFAAACVECHKGAPRALAHGKNASALTEFLFDHYTTSRQQAAALASYVLGGRGDEAVGGTAARGQKPSAERSKPADEAKTDAKTDTQSDAKPARRDTRASGKLEESVANPKRQPSAADDARAEPKPEDGDKPAVQPRHRREPKVPQQATEQTAAVAHAPNERVPVEPAHAAAAPERVAPAASNAGPAPNEGMPVPRDNIAD